MITATVVIKTNHFPGMSGRLQQADRDIRTKGALDIYAASIPYTPVDTGALRGNVTADEHGVHWHQGYAAYQEFGTSRGVTAKSFAAQGFASGYPSMLAAYRTIEGRLV